MFRKHLFVKLLSTSRPKILATRYPRGYFFSNPLYTSAESSPSAESPKIPAWFNYRTFVADSDEEFVIPSLASWVESQPNSDVWTEVMGVPNEEYTEADRVSEILKNRYSSHEEVVEALNGCEVSVSKSLIEQLLKRFDNDWISAFGVFSWAKTQTGYVHSAEACNSMVDVLGKARKFDLMWDLVKEMQKSTGYVTLDTFTKVVRRLAKAKMHDVAIEAFRGIEKFGISQDSEAMNVLMDALVKGDGVEHADLVFMEFMEQIPLTIASFNILIHGFCKARKVEDARRILDEMGERGFQLDVASYTCLIEAYCRDKDFRKVDAVLEEMQGKGCKPNVLTYTIIMKAKAKGGEVKRALEVYEQTKRDGCVPDSPFYSSLIVMLSKAGRYNDSCEIFQDMKKQGVKPDVIAYSAMITSACTHGREEEAFKFLQKMEEDACKPTLVTYSPLLKMCCRKKRMKVLSFLLSHMLKNDLSLDLGMYALLVKELCKLGKFDLACSFFKEMVLKGMLPYDVTFKELVEGLSKKNMTEAKQGIELLMYQAKEQNKTGTRYT